MIALVAVYVVACALILMSGRLLAEPHENASESKARTSEGWLDALLFVLLLVGMVRAAKRKRDDEEF